MGQGGERSRRSLEHRLKALGRELVRQRIPHKLPYRLPTNEAQFDRVATELLRILYDHRIPAAYRLLFDLAGPAVGRWVQERLQGLSLTLEPEEVVAHVFERFFRAHSSPPPHTDHAFRDAAVQHIDDVIEESTGKGPWVHAEIDPACFLARLHRLRLVREQGYAETATFERDCELLLSSPDATIRAQGFAHQAARASIAENAIDEATSLYAKASALHPANVDHVFNCWFLNLVRGDTKGLRSYWGVFELARRRQRSTPAARRARDAAYATVLRSALAEGHLGAATGRRAQRQLQQLMPSH
ncbi:MAG: hypothetical protein AB1486_27260 [Planctomycetota bacterium]